MVIYRIQARPSAAADPLRRPPEKILARCDEQQHHFCDKRAPKLRIVVTAGRGGSWYLRNFVAPRNCGTADTIQHAVRSDDARNASRQHCRYVAWCPDGLLTRYTYQERLPARQAQIIRQNLSLNDFNDGMPSVSFKNGSAYTGRAGARYSERSARE